MVFADEIYDKILYDDAVHHHRRARPATCSCLTFSGLSKAYRVAGFRSGWVVVSGPKEHARDFLEGLTMLANMRMCANVPAQHAIQTALGGYQSIHDLIAARAAGSTSSAMLAWRAAQRDPGRDLRASRGARCTASRGSTPRSTGSTTTSTSCSTCCGPRRSWSSTAPGFNWPEPDHFRLVTLPDVDDLTDAIGRIGRFLATYRQ